MTRSTTFAFLVATGLALSLAGCGGGGGGGGSGSVVTPPPPVSGTVSGTAIKGPVNGATVTAYGISNGTMGAKIASSSTDAQGNFSLAMGTYAGAVMLQMTGGTFTDEASGSNMSDAGRGRHDGDAAHDDGRGDPERHPGHAAYRNGPNAWPSACPAA